MGSQDLEVRLQELKRLFHVYELGSTARTKEASRIDKMLISKGLVELTPTEVCITMTALGIAHIHQLTNLPLPQSF